MALPLTYSIHNVRVRRGSSILTALGIAMTVAIFAGVIALRDGFEAAFQLRGEEEIALYLRLGATSEGESGMSRERAQILIKERPEIARDGEGRPLAAAESYLAVFMGKVGGGKTNVPLRGIQPMSLKLRGDSLGIREGRWLQFGSDEVVVGRPLTSRIESCRLGDTLMLNFTPFKVVGVYECEGAQGSEIWGDVERMMEALDRGFFQRVIARVEPGTDLDAVKEKLKNDPRAPSQVRSERDYMEAQTGALGYVLTELAKFLTAIMGIAAILGAMNTMLASVAARTHEIGVLLAIGFRRWQVFLAFLAESALIGLAGGLIGVLIILPFDGIETGAMNWNTFTDVSFAFRHSPALVVEAVLLAFLLGVLGGVVPALRA
ncbi:MAG: ABC transporter permease, partial [Planctomycetota bacterium]